MLLVFTTDTGSPLDPSNVRRTLTRIANDAGIGRVHPHQLRHATASLLSDAGVPLEDIADTLGHRSVTITADIYCHPPSIRAHPTRARHDRPRHPRVAASPGPPALADGDRGHRCTRTSVKGSWCSSVSVAVHPGPGSRAGETALSSDVVRQRSAQSAATVGSQMGPRPSVRRVAQGRNRLQPGPFCRDGGI
jgi:hypothetical protein